MTDPVIIERSEIASIARNAVSQFIYELKLKDKLNSKWITQNQAHQLIGRAALKKAKYNGLVRFRKINPDSKFGRVKILRSDLDKIINNPV